VYTFKNIIGQRDLIESLKNAFFSNRVGHAYLFSGEKGIGKTTLAKAFAALLLCSEPNGDEPCGRCKPCLLLKNSSNPDFCLIEPDKGTIKIEAIRQMQDDIMVKPLYSERKVYIIRDAETMTMQAQNCLLKTLEEPPRFAVIILTTPSLYGLKETIRSRILKYNLKKNTFREVLELLNRLYSASRSNEFIASYSGGIIGTAMKLAGSENFDALRNEIIELADQVGREGLVAVFDKYDIFEKNKEDIDTILDMMEIFYRDILVCKRTRNEGMLINSDKKDIIIDSAKRYTSKKLVDNIEIINTTRSNLNYNTNYQLSIEVMLMKLQEA